MTVKEYLVDKTLIAVETVEGLILNLVLENDSLQSLLVDTSNIQSGTPLNRTEDFVLTENDLTANGITIDINTTNVEIPEIGLGSEIQE